MLAVGFQSQYYSSSIEKQDFPDRFVTSLFGSVLRESVYLLTNTISADAVSRTFLADSLFLCIAI